MSPHKNKQSWQLLVTASIDSAGKVVVSEELQPDRSLGLPVFKISVSERGVPSAWAVSLRRCGLNNGDIAAVQTMIESLRAQVVRELLGSAG